MFFTATDGLLLATATAKEDTCDVKGVPETVMKLVL
jgi:hypothetical protein